MENNRELFNREFDESQLIDDTFAKMCNTEGIQAAVQYLIDIGATWLNMDNYYILYFISEYTKNTFNDDIKNKMFDRIKKQEDVLSIDIYQNDVFKVPQLIIKKKDYEITLMKLSELIPESLKAIEDLEDNRRLGTCHEKAYDICRYLGIPCDIVTGYVYGFSDKSKFHHSWIEAKLRKNSDEIFVIDGTLNAVFNKEGYYKLRHAEAINKISNETLNSDVKEYLRKLEKMDPGIYYFFRDEIINDLEKNKNVFKR